VRRSTARPRPRSTARPRLHLTIRPRRRSTARPRPRSTAHPSLQRLDEVLMARSHGLRSPRLDRLLVVLTRAASYSRLWLCIACLLATGGGRRGRRAAGRGVTAIAIAASVANGPAKLLVRRRRPLPRFGRTLIPMPRSTSFPSGHSASAFAFATGACAEQPALAPLLVPLAGAVVYSRVHAGVHYPSDVVAGAAIGVGAGLLARHVPGGCLRLVAPPGLRRRDVQPSPWAPPHERGTRRTTILDRGAPPGAAPR
jgi:membrane-associated phospholipid phosphatase